MARFERLSLASGEWDKLTSTFSDRIVFQTAAWLGFLAETQKGEPVFAALKEGDETLGYFTGLIVRKMGLRILGSPFRGWSCPYMGFNIRPGVSRRPAVAALPDLAFRQLRCAHFEVVDLHVTPEDLTGLDFDQEVRATMELDLTADEDALLANMTKSCRWTVRKAEKNGVLIEEARDAAFAEEYAEQLEDVFAKQSLVPPFGVDRVQALLKHLLPTGMLMCLRAREPGGRCIATGVYPGANQTAFFWGGASWREHQKLYPNELLQWQAMCRWKQRGLKAYNMVGTMDFKQKFGGRQTAALMFAKSRYRWISLLRNSAPRLMRGALRLAWKVKHFGKAQAKPAPAADKPIEDGLSHSSG